MGFADEILSEMGMRPASSALPGGQNNNAPAKEDAAPPPNNDGDPAKQKTDGEPPEGENANNSIQEENGEETKLPLNNTAAPKENTAQQPNTEDQDLDEEALLAQLNKKGIKIASLADLQKQPDTPLSPEEVAKQQEEEESNVVQYALREKIYDKTTLESYGRDKARSVDDIAFEVYKGNQLAKDATLTEEMIQDRFNQRFATGAEEDEWRREEGAADMALIAGQYMNDKYGTVTNAQELYRQHVQGEQAARDYKSAVEAQIGQLPAELNFTVDGKSYSYKPFEATVAAIKDQFLTPEQFSAFGAKVPDKDLLKNSIMGAIQMKDLSHIVTTIAAAHSAATLLDQKAGRQGVIARSETNEEQHVPSNSGNAAKILESMKN